MRLPAWRAAVGLLLISITAGSPPLAACVPVFDWWELIESSDLIALARVEKEEPTLAGRWVESRGSRARGGGRSLWLEALREVIFSSWGEPPLGRLVLRPSQSWKGPFPRRLRVATPWVGQDREGGDFLVFAQRGLWGWTLEKMFPLSLLRASGTLEGMRGWVEEGASRDNCTASPRPHLGRRQRQTGRGVGRRAHRHRSGSRQLGVIEKGPVLDFGRQAFRGLGLYPAERFEPLPGG